MLALPALVLIPAAWLLPNHYHPWLSAWQEGIALVFLALSLLGTGIRLRLPALWVTFVGLAVVSVIGQWAAGHIHFAGDAWITLLYVLGLAGALAAGSGLADQQRAAGLGPLEMVALGAVAAAVLSVGIALVQWTGTGLLGLWGAELPPGGRPFANVAQPNHLCTLAFWGLCSAALLFETRQLGRMGFYVTALTLLAGMVMSGSRTGWLQVAVFALTAFALGCRVGARLGRGDVLMVVTAFVLLNLLWPVLNEAISLSAGRTAASPVQGDLRWPLWRVLAAAVIEQPLWGYGWQQIALAHQAVALDHPPVHRYFEHSHNLVLDLLLWCGLPVGVMLTVLGAWAVLRPVSHLRDARALWLMVAVLGVLTHAMVEYPHGYAYFLLPVGIALGAVYAMTFPGAGWPVPVVALRGAGALGLAALAVVAVEYLQAEQNYRLLRLESARIGTSRIESQPADLRVLTQLGAFLRFARTEARPGMTDEEVEMMRRVSERYGYAPVMLRYALAAGLNGDAAASRLALQRLCSIQLRDRCDEGRQAWAGLQQAHPVLRDIVYP